MNTATLNNQPVVVKRPISKIGVKRSQAINFTKQWESYLASQARAALDNGNVAASMNYINQADNAHACTEWLKSATHSDISNFWKHVFDYYQSNS